MNMKKDMLNYFFISMLVYREKQWDSYKMEVVIRKGGIVIKKVNRKKKVVIWKKWNS